MLGSTRPRRGSARGAGLETMARELDAMSEVEWEHAVFFGGVLGFAASRARRRPRPNRRGAGGGAAVSS